MRRLALALCSCLAAALALTSIAHADVNDFTITNFEADYTLSNKDRQGTLRVKERLDLVYTDNNHGILRAIPNTYKKHQLQLHINQVASPSGAPAQYTTYQSGGNTVLKIGDPNQTVTGEQSYIIDYTFNNVITFYGDHDELFWDINGDQWDQTFQKVSLTLHLPSGLKLDSHTPICYSGGGFGSTEQACTISYDQTGQALVAQTTRPLTARQTLTIVAGFEKGYFQPPAWYETAGEYAWSVVKFFIPFLLVAGVAWRNWYKYGRDPKGRGTIVPEYEAPDDLKPIEAGTIVDFSTDNRDITATIIDLAIHGYIKIIETKNVRRFRKDTTTYSLRLLKTDFSGLKDFEKSILGAIFDNLTEGQEVDLATLKYKLSSEATALRRIIKKSLVERGYLRSKKVMDSLKFAGLLAVCFIVALIFTGVVGGLAVVGIILGSVLATIFIILLPARTAKGVAAKDSILGLKMYLQVAEAERIKKLQSPDAPYAPHSAEPKRTVELFEKLLPYAMVLGVEQQWAKQFEGIYKDPPDWYQGQRTGFSAIYFASALNTGIGSSINAAFSAPSSSSSSGFSGGGGSGGGGGGGGGGGW